MLGRNSAPRQWARTVKRDVIALWIAARDPRTPWWIKLLAGAVAAYALSPIDLIPDFIPVLGYLDDIVLVPAGIWAVARLIPPDLMTDYRAEASRMAERPRSRAGAVAILLVWLLVLGMALAWTVSYLPG